FRGLRPLRAGRRGWEAHPPALDQEPGRRERSSPDTRGRRSPEGARRRAQRRDRGRARRLVDLGRRLRAASTEPRDPRRRWRPSCRARPPLPLRGARPARHRARARPRKRARPRTRADARRRRARPPPHLHGDARPAASPRLPRTREAVLGALRMTAFRVGHLYPDYLNIYADRGTLAVLTQRAPSPLPPLPLTPLTPHTTIPPRH